MIFVAKKICYTRERTTNTRELRSKKMPLTAGLTLIIMITSCRAPPLGAQLVADYFIAFSNLACRYEAEKKHIVYHYSRLSEEIRLKSESGRTARTLKLNERGRWIFVYTPEW